MFLKAKIMQSNIIKTIGRRFLIHEIPQIKLKVNQSIKFTLCTTGGSDLGNLLQGGEAYVKFFAENTHFQGRSDCAPEYQSNTPRQETN